MNSCLKKELRQKERDIQILIKDLNTAQESNARKLEFIAYLTHEFKTPLSAIMGFSSLMEERELPRKKQIKFCKNILSASKHMLHLMSNTIDMARAEIDKISLDYSEFVPSDAIKEVLGILEEKIAQKHINAITYFAGIPIIADKRRFKQLIFNLVSNAVKFNKIGGTIKIRTSISDNTFKFEITDTGKGISTDKQDKIFEFFSNFHYHKLGDDECTGVGLSLCKKIVMLHNGEINFCSEVQKGSCFWFSIPIKPALKEETFEYMKV